MADGKIIIETELDNSKVEAQLIKLKTSASSAAKESSKSFKGITTVLDEQKKKLDELKNKYIDVATSQGKNSQEAQKLKGEYSKLAKEISTSEKSTDKLEKGLEKLNKTKLDKIKSSLTKLKDIAGSAAKGIAVGVGAIGTALVGAVGKSVQMAGELEQQIGGTEAVFGDLASTVQDKAVKAFSQMGVSANDFMQTANKMGSLMQGAGLSVEDSMYLSTEAMQRAADVASVMGISTESAMESIAGAAKGNFTINYESAMLVIA